MCGITGLIKKNHNAVVDIKNTLLQMSENIKHRGPDDYAKFADEHCGLAIRRLAILDLTLGLYPFTSDDGNLVLVLNGEIYNYRILRDELIKFGYAFRTNCDAEVVLKGYIQWGIEVFSKLRGMFAVALWDKSKQKLTLVRDRFGIKPIYYVNNDDVFLFCSEAKAFFNLDKSVFNPTLDYENIELLLGFMFLPKSEETIIKGVCKLAPATILEVQEGNINFTKYWDIKASPQIEKMDFNSATERLEELLVESVQMHMLSDAPLGVLLSGGLDSSLITAIMAKRGLSSNISTFTAKFDHKFNESHFAKQTAAYLGTQHTEIAINLSHINKNIEDHIETFDDLTSFDGGTITTKLLCEQIRKSGIKVLLLGEGADELFGGYSWFGLASYPFRILPKYLISALYYYAISRNITINTLKYISYWNKVTTENVDLFSDITLRELDVQLPNHLLMKVDKGSMANSIEARVPYLDHVLAEFVYNLPQKYKYVSKWYSPKKSREKYILREVAKKYLPKNIVNRKKQGFMLPMHDVLNQDLDKVKNYVLDPNSVGSKILSKKTREGLFRLSPLESINMQNEYFIWRLFILEVWVKKYGL